MQTAGTLTTFHTEIDRYFGKHQATKKARPKSDLINQLTNQLTNQFVVLDTKNPNYFLISNCSNQSSTILSFSLSAIRDNKETIKTSISGNDNSNIAMVHLIF